MKSILVTGGAGFIGSNFVLHLLEKYPDYQIINLDKLTYAANKDYLVSAENNPRHKLVVGDILDKELVHQLFSQHEISGVVHFAAESHVDNSISGPAVFIETNVKGTLTLLEAARAHWLDAPFKVKAVVLPISQRRTDGRPLRNSGCTHRVERRRLRRSVAPRTKTGGGTRDASLRDRFAQ